MKKHLLPATAKRAHVFPRNDHCCRRKSSKQIENIKAKPALVGQIAAGGGVVGSLGDQKGEGTVNFSACVPAQGGGAKTIFTSGQKHKTIHVLNNRLKRRGYPKCQPSKKNKEQNIAVQTPKKKRKKTERSVKTNCPRTEATPGGESL